MRFLNKAIGIGVVAASHAWGQPACHPPKKASLPGDSADRLLHERRYPDLVRWVADHPSAYALGVLANRRNQNAESLRLLEPLVGQLDTARRHVALKTLADDYAKTYRYGAAADALRQLVRQSGAIMDSSERADVRANADVFDLLRGAPPQRSSNPRAFSVPVRRDTIGLLETVVAVGSDSAWWIIDTGANFSTITESVARRLGLTVSSGAARTQGISGGYVPLRVAIIPELRLGPARFENVVAFVLADSALSIPITPPFQVTAVLGYPVLEALDRLTITPESVSVSPHPLGAPTLESNLFLEQLNPIMTVTVDGSTGLYQFDSGASTTDLGVQFCAAYPRRVARAPKRQIHLAGAGGEKVFPGYMIKNLPMTIGGRTTTLDSVTVFSGVTHAPFEPFWGNIGQDVIRQFGGWTIDFRAMTFEPGA